MDREKQEYSFTELMDATVEDSEMRNKIDELIELKKNSEHELDMLIVDDNLVDFARQMAEYYNETVGSFRPEQNQVTADALDSILLNMVRVHSK